MGIFCIHIPVFTSRDPIHKRELYIQTGIGGGEQQETANHFWHNFWVGCGWDAKIKSIVPDVLTEGHMFSFRDYIYMSIQ